MHLSADGEVVVFHDEALKPEIVRGRAARLDGATGPLLTGDELRRAASL